MHDIEHSPALADIDIGDYNALFFPGGHGTMWDFAQSDTLATVLGEAFDRGTVIGAVCHGPAALVSAQRADGQPIVQDRRISSFTDEEERAVGLEIVVPYLLETRLRDYGAHFEKAPNFQSHAVRDGNLVTGQNPASAAAVGELMVAALRDATL